MRSGTLLSLLILSLLNTSAGLGQSLLPMPPECARVRMHPDRSWLVFFDSHSAALTPRARVILNELASAFLDEHGRLIALNGYTDGAETLAEDSGLGMRRAQAVAEVLQQAGVRAALIYTKDLGSTNPLVPRPPDAPEPQNRRVEPYPMGMHSDFHRAAVRTCKDWIRSVCFGPQRPGQQTLCQNALNAVAPE